MQEPNLPNTIDLIFVVLVFVVGPSLDHLVLWPRMQQNLTSGEAGARTRVYWVIMAGLGVPTILIAGRWIMLARPWSALWLLPPRGWRLVAGMLGVLAVAALWHWQARKLARLSADRRAALRARSAHLLTLAPRTSGEYGWWLCVSITAGVCEELLYRGFLVWALQAWVGLWLAAALSVAVFGAVHAYQGKDMVRPAVVGALLQGFALLTGSILPNIVVHAMLDVATSGYILVREPARGANPLSV